MITKPKRRLWWTVKDVGAENDLLNDLSFNLCVVPQSPVVRLVVYFEVVEVIKTEVVRGHSEASQNILVISGGGILS